MCTKHCDKLDLLLIKFKKHSFRKKNHNLTPFSKGSKSGKSVTKTSLVLQWFDKIIDDSPVPAPISKMFWFSNNFWLSNAKSAINRAPRHTWYPTLSRPRFFYKIDCLTWFRLESWVKLRQWSLLSDVLAKLSKFTKWLFSFKMVLIMKNVVVLSENGCHFVKLLSFAKSLRYNNYIVSAWLRTQIWV